MDLKRTGNINIEMPSITIEKGGSWEVTDQLYPVPYSELILAPQLEQNAGY